MHTKGGDRYSGCFPTVDMIHEEDMLLGGSIAELIIWLEPMLYRKFIWKNKREKPVVYIKLKKALYGT